LVQQLGGRRFMLEGVSVDPGRTMLPVSPQISAGIEKTTVNAIPANMALISFLLTER
jgi:hypothetical protein